jgi:hypothetical protein
VLAVIIWPFKLNDRVWENYIQARRYREGQEYLQLTSRLDQLAGPGAKILAPPVYWIGLHDHPYADIYVYERVERQYGLSPAQYLDEVRPDFVITDAKIATERRVERLLYNELDRRANYELVVRHKNYGDVAIYRLHWPRADGRAADHDRYGAGPAEAANTVGRDAEQHTGPADTPAADPGGEADASRHP